MMSVSQISDVAHSNTSIANIPRAVMNVALRNDCINLCHMNVQSLCARQLSKFDETKNCFINSKLDLICVTESWLHENIPDSSIAVEGYNFLRNDRGHSRGGGICVYYKNDLFCKEIAASQPSGDGNRTEYLFIEVRVNQDAFLLGVIYCPPGVDCAGVLEQKLAELSCSYTKIILIGDFNTNLKKSCIRTNRFCSVMDSFGIFCINNEPTHFYSGGCSLIDLLLTNDENFVLNFNQVSLSMI